MLRQIRQKDERYAWQLVSSHERCPRLLTFPLQGHLLPGLAIGAWKPVSGKFDIREKRLFSSIKGCVANF